jgi:hypothetical protein
MKKLNLFLSIALVIALTGCEKSPFKKDFEKADLYGEWNLAKKEINGNTQYPGEAEKNDKLVLNSSGSFEWVDQGQSMEGDWTAHVRMGQISLMENGVYECIYFNVEEVNSSELVLEKEAMHLGGEKFYFTSASVTPAPTSQSGSVQ